MQGIKLTRFTRVVNAFSAASERVYHCSRARLSLQANAFIAEVERVYRYSRTRLSLWSSAFITGSKHACDIRCGQARFSDTTCPQQN